ncbi:MAG: multiheme c-type cytochrome, partial [bacterium]
MRALARWLAVVLVAAPAVAAAQATQTSASPHGSFTAPCVQCHRPEAWRPLSVSPAFKHAPGRFPLEGAHAKVTCTTCHTRLDFTGVARTCATCHRDVHQGELGANCATCHTMRSFLDVAHMRQQHQLTTFPLTGGHAAVDCRSCHTPRAPRQQAFVNLPTTCVTCHAANYSQARNPPHSATGFPRDCTTCHTTAAWRGAPFDHNATQFPLTGAHRAANCQTCHADKVYRGKPTSCASCHQQQFAAAKAPPHAGFPATCETCHNTAAWAGASFDHGTTQFPLTGAHKASACADCHRDGVYRGKPTTCVSCHQTKYDQTKSPPHAAAGFSTNCQTCHTTTTWPGAPFDHGVTQFALTGAHRAATCASCHSDGVYRGKPMTCVSCHQTAYDKTTKIPHSAAGFPTTCETCHSTTAWLGAPFDHATTQFPLTGAHRSVDCRSCHADGVYRGKPSTCVACHQTKYDQTKSPPHAAAGFSTNCQTCHTTTTWPGAVFDHSATQFPLAGAHRAVSCASCHADGVYRGKPTTCAACHQAKYSATTSPAHAAAGFPTTCELCHSATAWT